jgi:hypothetical protein
VVGKAALTEHFKKELESGVFVFNTAVADFAERNWRHFALHRPLDSDNENPGRQGSTGLGPLADGGSVCGRGLPGHHPRCRLRRRSQRSSNETETTAASGCCRRTVRRCLTRVSR